MSRSLLWECTVIYTGSIYSFGKTETSISTAVYYKAIFSPLPLLALSSHSQQELAALLILTHPASLRHAHSAILSQPFSLSHSYSVIIIPLSYLVQSGCVLYPSSQIYVVYSLLSPSSMYRATLDIS